MMDKLYQYVSTKENVGINLCRISIAIVFMWTAKCILAQNQHERDYTGKVSAGLR